MVEQEYTPTYVAFIFSPALCSLVLSSILLVNFFFFSKHLQSYLYHRLSATLAVFDVIQEIGTVLGAPFLFSADEDKCAYREYIFLFGSFCKTLTVLYISGTISYVIHFAKMPNIVILKRVMAGLTVFTTACFIVMPTFNATATLCKDPTAGNFRLETVSRESRVSFSLCYVFPIVACFFIVIILIANTIVRLRSMFNSALMKLLVRLLPGPVIFLMALLPSSLFQIIVLGSGHENSVMKKLALLGINLSGALYAMFYFFDCYLDGVFFFERLSNSERWRLRHSGPGESSAVDMSSANFSSSVQSPSMSIQVEMKSETGSSFMTPTFNSSNLQ